MKKTLLSLVALVSGSLLSMGQDAKTAAPAATPAAATPAATTASDSKAAAPAATGGELAKLKLGVIPGKMAYDKKELTCKAGQKVVILFQNAGCPLQHNFILVKPGTRDAVGDAVEKLTLADPVGAATKLYVPDSKDVLIKGAKGIKIGESELIEFTAPAEAGDYPYLCTYPGHWRMMNGVLKVTK